MTAKVFIDGEAGTTGLRIRQRLASRRDIELLSVDPARRKDPEARCECLNAADAVILCLPDDAAREAVSLIDNEAVRVVDASTAHRTSADWTYGFAELTAGQRQAIRASKRVSNPGCYPTGFLALVRPLVADGLLPADWPVTVNAVSGYSGGGRSMIAQFEDPADVAYTTTAYRPYAMALNHKHVAEMRAQSGLSHAPLFTPAVGRFLQGMIVEVPLQLWAIPGAPSLDDIQASLTRAYADQSFVEVASREEAAVTVALDAEALNGSNRMRLYVFGSATAGQARLAAVLDNLGKGASGAAVQNLNLMLGLDESLGL